MIIDAVPLREIVQTVVAPSRSTITSAGRPRQYSRVLDHGGEREDHPDVHVGREVVHVQKAARCGGRHSRAARPARRARTPCSRRPSDERALRQRSRRSRRATFARGSATPSCRRATRQRSDEDDDVGHATEDLDRRDATGSSERVATRRPGLAKRRQATRPHVGVLARDRRQDPTGSGMLCTTVHRTRPDTDEDEHRCSRRGSSGSASNHTRAVPAAASAATTASTGVKPAQAERALARTVAASSHPAQPVGAPLGEAQPLGAPHAARSLLPRGLRHGQNPTRKANEAPTTPQRRLSPLSGMR